MLAALLSKALASFRAEDRPVRRKLLLEALIRGEVSIWHGLVLMVERDKAFSALSWLQAARRHLSFLSGVSNPQG
jgi:hypothetical protein